MVKKMMPVVYHIYVDVVIVVDVWINSQLSTSNCFQIKKTVFYVI